MSLNKNENWLKEDVDISEGDYQQEIVIKGANTNNLQNIDLSIPKNQLVVITGVSGSGKSSLIMDTLYAEGQRRYVESLSSYARQFLNRMKKPDVDYITGISPAIAIEQKVSGGNARSTVGTLTEIYDYLRLLYARIGKTYSPVSKKLVTKHSVSDVVDYILSVETGTKLIIAIPIFKEAGDRTIGKELSLLLEKGYSRMTYQDEPFEIDQFIETSPIDLDLLINDKLANDLIVLIDRIIADDSTGNQNRIADSVDIAFKESHGYCIVATTDWKKTIFSNKFEMDGILFLEPDQQLFNFNNSLGACKKCEGYGKIIGIDS